MQQEINVMEDIQVFVEDLYELIQQCVCEEEENKVIRKVDRKKTKAIARTQKNRRGIRRIGEEEN